MKKSVFMRIMVLALCAVMILSLFACENGEAPTEAPTQEQTEKETDEPTQEPTDEPTQTPTEETEEESTEAPTDEPTDEPTQAPTDEPTDEPTQSVTDTETETMPETESETTPESETDPEDCEHVWGDEVAANGEHTKECTLCGEKNVSKKHFYEVNEKGVSHICACGATKSCLAVFRSDANGHWRGGCDICEIEALKKKPHTDPTLVAKTENDVTSYEYVCECGYALKSYIPSADVNYYITAGQFVNGDTSGKVLTDGEVMYQRFEITSHGQTIPLVHSGEVTDAYTVDVKGGSGHYFVFKIRTENVEALSWRITSKGEGETAPNPSSAYLGKRSAITDGEWITYVVDIQELIDASGISTYADAGDLSVTKFAAGFMYGNDGGGAVEDTYIDIAYFAVCDSWEEVADVVGEGTVTYTNWMDESSDELKRYDGARPVVTEGENATKVIYQKTGKELYVYIRSPYAAKYTRYKFAYCKDNSSAYEGWMLHSVAICDTDLKVLYYTSRELATDLEGALQEPNAADFIGGFHGDEKYRTVKITVDGAELDMSEDYTFTACDNVTAVVESDVFRCNSTEKVFDRTKTLSWTEAGMEIENNYVTVAPITIQRPAVGMLVVYADDSGYNDLVTKHWDHISDQWIDVVWPSSPTANHSQNGMTYAKLDGKYISASLEIKDFGVNGEKTANRGWFNYDTWGPGNQRVKIYLDIFSNKTLAVGDVMHCTAVHTTFAKE